jgi:hypothetical protein
MKVYGSMAKCKVKGCLVTKTRMFSMKAVGKKVRSTEMAIMNTKVIFSREIS